MIGRAGAPSCQAGPIGYTSAARDNRDEKKMTAVDPELERHMRTWIGFTRFMKASLAAIVITLILMAIFLL